MQKSFLNWRENNSAIYFLHCHTELEASKSLQSNVSELWKARVCSVNQWVNNLTNPYEHRLGDVYVFSLIFLENLHFGKIGFLLSYPPLTGHLCTMHHAPCSSHPDVGLEVHKVPYTHERTCVSTLETCRVMLMCVLCFTFKCFEVSVLSGQAIAGGFLVSFYVAGI